MYTYTYTYTYIYMHERHVYMRMLLYACICVVFAQREGETVEVADDVSHLRHGERSGQPLVTSRCAHVRVVSALGALIVSVVSSRPRSALTQIFSPREFYFSMAIYFGARRKIMVSENTILVENLFFQLKALQSLLWQSRAAF